MYDEEVSIIALLVALGLARFEALAEETLSHKFSTGDILTSTKICHNILEHKNEDPIYYANFSQRFADMAIKIILADMIVKYDIRPCAKTEIPLKFAKQNLLLQTLGGIWVTLAKRKI